jgi:hypothetical protein
MGKVGRCDGVGGLCGLFEPVTGVTASPPGAWPLSASCRRPLTASTPIPTAATHPTAASSVVAVRRRRPGDPAPGRRDPAGGSPEAAVAP